MILLLRIKMFFRSFLSCFSALLVNFFEWRIKIRKLSAPTIFSFFAHSIVFFLTCLLLNRKKKEFRLLSLFCISDVQLCWFFFSLDSFVFRRLFNSSYFFFLVTLFSHLIWCVFLYSSFFLKRKGKKKTEEKVF